MADIWSQQASYARTLAVVDEMTPILRDVRGLGAKMNHFVNQIQYYMSFEVLETSWKQLLAGVDSARDLNDLISTHSKFVTRVTHHMFLSQSTAVSEPSENGAMDIIPLVFVAVSDGVVNVVLGGVVFVSHCVFRVLVDSCALALYRECF
eukprot:m.57003 g.57003  ORF g.57003 m.57003 type:complete len:150 (-) comp11581_c0_seq3:75-524(-)